MLAGVQWNCLHHAVDKFGQTVDFLPTAHRDVTAARRYFERAINLHEVPASIAIYKSGANSAAARGMIGDSDLTLELRQSKMPEQRFQAVHEDVIDARRRRDCIDELQLTAKLPAMTDGSWPTGDCWLSELLAPKRPVRSGLERQLSGVDFVYRSTRNRPEAGIAGRPVWGSSVDGLNQAAHVRVRPRPGALPEMRQSQEDHRRDPVAGGD